MTENLEGFVMPTVGLKVTSSHRNSDNIVLMLLYGGEKKL